MLYYMCACVNICSLVEFTMNGSVDGPTRIAVDGYSEVLCRVMQPKVAIHATLCVGLVSGVLLVGLWDKTTGGQSVAFITLAFFMAMVDCTSSVLYMPFMGNYQQQFLIW